MVKERPVSLYNGDMRGLLVRTDLTNEDSTRNRQRIRIMDHPHNLLEVFRARLAIAQGLTKNYIRTGPNQYSFTQTFLNREALRVFELKATELRHEMVANLVLVMNHIMTCFSPTECLSKQKRYIQYNMDKPWKLTTRQYMGLVRDLNSRMAQMPSLFNNNQ